MTPSSRLLALAAAIATVTCTDATAPTPVASQLAFSAQPSAAAAGSSIAAVTVELRDASGAVVPNATGSVTIAFASNPGNGTLSGTTTVAAVNGVATFSNLSVEKAAAGYTLTATATGLTSATSAAFTIAAGAPATLTAIAGSTAATVGASVATTPSVSVSDQFGNPVSGVEVTFAVASGGGSITGATQTTDAAGIATLGSWTLGTTAGKNTLTAAIPDFEPITFSAKATADVPATIEIVAGDGQTAHVDEAVHVDPRVLVKDAHGNVLRGIEVTWTVASGNGSATAGAAATTDVDGVAKVGSWVLGTVVGANTLTAAVTGVAPVTFTASSIPAEKSYVHVQAGNYQFATVATTLPIAPRVRVTDFYDNPKAGVPVTFSVTYNNGSITGASQVTDDSGTVTLGSWTLGTKSGGNNLKAAVSRTEWGEIIAMGVPGPPVAMEIYAGKRQVSQAGSEVAIKPSVRVTDAYGNGKGTVLIVFSVASGGGSATVPALYTNALGIATVGSWTLGSTLTANTMTAEVYNTPGIPPVTFTADMVQSIALGDLHTCALTTSGVPYCWGAGFNGQIGDGKKLETPTPTLVAGKHVFASMVAGGNRSCGLRADGTAFCWGNNFGGQIGNNSEAEAITPTRVQTGINFASLASGVDHTCGIGVGGAAWCWGYGLNGQLGDSTYNSRLTPVRVSGSRTYSALAGGSAGTCGLSLGEQYCWGFIFYPRPTHINGGKTFTQLVAGRYHECGLDASGHAFCWGYSFSGQRGDNTDTLAFEPVPVSGGHTFASISAAPGGSGTCGLTAAGVAWCWGDNDSGQLGDGSTQDRWAPVKVSGGLQFISILPSANHTCGVTTAGALYCWGSNAYHRLGTGDNNDYHVPRRVDFP